MGPKVKLLFFAIDVEADFSSPTSICSPTVLKKGRPRMSVTPQVLSIPNYEHEHQLHS
jgi:hypothetical protein